MGPLFAVNSPSKTPFTRTASCPPPAMLLCLRTKQKNPPLLQRIFSQFAAVMINPYRHFLLILLSLLLLATVANVEPCNRKKASYSAIEMGTLISLILILILPQGSTFPKKSPANSTGAQRTAELLLWFRTEIGIYMSHLQAMGMTNECTVDLQKRAVPRAIAFAHRTPTV